MRRRVVWLGLVAWLAGVGSTSTSQAALTLRRSIGNPNAVAGDRFGSRLAAVGETPDLLVGAPGEGYDPPLTGGAHLFGARDWELRRSFPGGTTGDAVGHAVAAVGGFTGTLGAHVIVGAPGVDGGSIADAGVAFVYDAQTATIVQTLVAPAPLAGAGFGTATGGDATSSLATDVFVGSAAEATVHRFDAASGVLVASYADPGSVAGFGSTVAVYGAGVFIGLDLPRSGEHLG